MYTQVASKLSASGTPEFTQAVSMSGGNAVEVEAANYTSSTTVTFTLQGGNDLSNWADLTSLGVAGPGEAMATKTAIAYAFVRLKVERTTGSGSAIVNAGLNVANL